MLADSQKRNIATTPANGKQRMRIIPAWAGHGDKRDAMRHD